MLLATAAFIPAVEAIFSCMHCRFVMLVVLDQRSVLLGFNCIAALLEKSGNFVLIK
jgi:hypothetical protein